MAEQRNIKLAKSGGDVTIEIAVSLAEPAVIDLGLYDPDRKKSRDMGSALTGGSTDPRAFPVAKSGPDIGALDQKIIGVFVSISSSESSASKSVTVSSQVRQDGAAIAASQVLIAGTATNGGAQFLITYNLNVP